MVVMPEECSYNVLLANDVMGPFKVDILRSTNEVKFHFRGDETTVTLLEDLTESNELPNAYFVCTVTDGYDGPWVDDPPSFKFKHSKNVKMQKKLSSFRHH